MKTRCLPVMFIFALSGIAVGLGQQTRTTATAQIAGATVSASAPAPLRNETAVYLVPVGDTGRGDKDNPACADPGGHGAGCVQTSVKLPKGAVIDGEEWRYGNQGHDVIGRCTVPKGTDWADCGDWCRFRHLKAAADPKTGEIFVHAEFANWLPNINRLAQFVVIYHMPQ